MKKEPTRRQQWLPYVRLIADKIALKDWTVQISESQPADRGAMASVNPCEGRKWGTIFLADGHFGESREEQRHTIVHELLHCTWPPTCTPSRKRPKTTQR